MTTSRTLAERIDGGAGSLATTDLRVAVTAVPTTAPSLTTASAWTRTEVMSSRLLAPTARSRTSASTFCTVRMRKKTPVTMPTTR